MREAARLPRSGAPQYFGKDLEAMSFARNYRSWILAEFEPYLGGSVAEVGAGVGSFSEALLHAGIDRLVAFEPSENMFPLLQEALGPTARATAVNDFFGPGLAGERFDSVVYVNVLEHVEDHAAELAVARGALAPQGHLLILVPALPWLYSEMDRQLGHYRRYTRDGLVELVESSGFVVVNARYFDLGGVIPWYVHFTLLKRQFSSGSVGLYDRLAVPLTRAIERLVSPPVGKSVILIARRD